jgi:hypothetical protein
MKMADGCPVYGLIGSLPKENPIAIVQRILKIEKHPLVQNTTHRLKRSKIRRCWRLRVGTP